MLSITATDLPRFVACNGSRLMGGFTPSVETDDTIKKEGDAAHWLVEQAANNKIREPNELVGKSAPNGIIISEQMIEDLARYMYTARSGGEVERDTSYTDKEKRYYVRGRADHTEFRNKTLYVNDFKYGWRIVEPDDNYTLISHAIGWLKSHEPRLSPYDITTFVFTIYQPRPYHPLGTVRSWTLTRDQFVEYTNQLEQALVNPTKDLQTGEHCYKCPSAVYCPAFRNSQMSALEVSQEAFTDNIPNDALAFLLDNVKRASDILSQAQKAYEELAFDRLRQGQVIQNYTLTKAESNREWKETVTPELLQMLTGKDLSVKKLITPRQAEIKGVSKEFVESMTVRFDKGLKLARMDIATKAEKLLGKKV